MADVGSLGQYKVVVTADYSQLQSQFKAMMDLVTNTTKAMTDTLNNSTKAMSQIMSSNIKAMVDSMNSAFSGAETTVKNFGATTGEVAKATQQASEAVKKSGDGFKSYAKQVKEAEVATQKAYQKLQDLQSKLQAVQVTPVKSSTDLLFRQNEESRITAQIKAQEEAYNKLRQKLYDLKTAEEQYKNSVNQRALAEKQALADRKVQDKAEDDMIKRRNRQREGEVRAVLQEEAQKDKAQQATANANSRRIQQLQTQYRVAYEEINKYMQAHAKMSEAVFIRLQGRITALGNEIRRLGADPAIANPLAGMDYNNYASNFSKWTDFFSSLKHHLTWMASATAIGAVVGIPAKTISTIAEVEKQMAQMKQVNKEVHENQVVLNQTTKDFIGIAERYGQSVNEVIKAGKLQLAA